jgi:hypothetical protein
MVRGPVYSTVQRNCMHIVYAKTGAGVRNLRSTVIGDVCGVCIGSQPQGYNQHNSGTHARFTLPHTV